MPVPRVTIVTVYYNRERLVERTLDSLLGQTYADFEILAIDDDSKDGTFERLSSYTDPRVVARTQENRGFTATMREAMSGVKSEYVAIQGSGDVSLPERIGRQVEFLDAHPEVGAVGCHVAHINELNGRRHLHIRSKPFDILKAVIFTHGEVMMRRSVYEAVGGYRAFFKYGQDAELWCRMNRVSELDVIPEVLYERYILSESVSANPLKRFQQLQYLNAIKQFEVIYRKYGFDPIEEFGDAAWMWVTARPDAVAKSQGIARKHRNELGANLADSIADLAWRQRRTPKTLCGKLVSNWARWRERERK